MEMIRRGEDFYTPDYHLTFQVVRVSCTGSWADIVCYQRGHQWRKRQPLRNGAFPFRVERIVDGPQR